MPSKKPYTFSPLVAGAVLLATLLPTSAEEVATTGARALTNAAQVRTLSNIEAARGLPVRLRGVVVLAMADAVILMDDEAGIYLQDTNGLLSSFGSGDTLLVEGVADPGDFAPIVKVRRVTKTGRGSIPEPKAVTFPELATGRFDAQWVEISGVVRRSKRVTPEPGPWNPQNWELRLATGGGQLSAFLPSAQGESSAVDSEIRLRGVCFYQFNKARQAINPVLSVPQQQPISVLHAAPADPAAVTVRPIGSLMQFSADDLFTHRVRVRGVVTHAKLKSDFWIQDAEHGLHVRSQQSENLAVGDLVDVFGFLSRDEYTPSLEDAVFQKLGSNRRPVTLTLAEPQQALDHNANLVELAGQILEVWQAHEGCELTVSSGPTRFPVRLQWDGARTVPKHWQPGSRVRIKGICSVNERPEVASATGTLEPNSFQILLRSPTDLTVLQLPSWWTAKHISWVLGITVSMLLLVVAVIVWNSKRRLREQALARMKSEAEFSAVWNERNRMARELHDTLAQGLGAISMQLEVVKRQLPADAEARQALEEARALARSNLADARNSIWNMRSQVLETGDLAKALGDILRSLTEGTETSGELRVQGQPKRLAPMTENNLLRIGQEAITNAARHARARRIEVVLQFTTRQLQLSVLDDGIGFDPEHPPKSDGGFGLVGMRERAQQLHAALTVASVPGEGSAFSLTLPLSGGFGTSEINRESENQNHHES